MNFFEKKAKHKKANRNQKKSEFSFRKKFMRWEFISSDVIRAKSDLFKDFQLLYSADNLWFWVN